MRKEDEDVVDATVEQDAADFSLARGHYSMSPVALTALADWHEKQARALRAKCRRIEREKRPQRKPNRFARLWARLDTWDLFLIMAWLVTFSFAVR